MNAEVADDTRLGEGAVIESYCRIGVDGVGDAVDLGGGAHLRSHTVIYRSVRTGERFHAGHGVLIRDRTTIGDDVSIGSHSVVEHSVTISIGVRIHSNCFIPELSVIGAGAWIGPSVVLTNARYPNRPDTKSKLEGVMIGERAVLGAGCVVLPGVAIGHDATIGAGAVVVRDVDPHATVVGNPGRPL